MAGIGQRPVIDAAGMAGIDQSQLARRVTGQQITLQCAVTDYVPLSGRDPFAVVVGAGQGTFEMRLLGNA